MKRKLITVLAMLFMFTAPVSAAAVIPQAAVTVQAAVKLKTTSLQIGVGQKGVIKLKNKKGKKVTWSIPQKDMGKVFFKNTSKNKAVVYGLAAGKADVIAQVGGQTFVCEVTVTGGNGKSSDDSGNGQNLPTESAPSGSVTVTDHGAVPDDGVDDTAAINEAVNAAAGGSGIVYIPEGKYDISINSIGIGIEMKSNVSLVMSGKTVLNVKGTDKDWYNVIYIFGQKNVTVKGGRISGERSSHMGDEGESGAGIGVYDSSNVTISSMIITSNWGDGIYLGTGSDSRGGCKNVTIENCTINKNRRNNIAIVYASDVTITGCTISDAYGASPQCGINIEPNLVNGSLPVCRNIRITDSIISARKDATLDGQYYCLMTIYYPDDRSVKSCDGVVINGCNIRGSVFNGSGANMTIKNSLVSDTFYDARDTQIISSVVRDHVRID